MPELRLPPWTCDPCGRPVTDGNGYLGVDWGAASQRALELARIEAAAIQSPLGVVSTAELLDVPAEVFWYVVHFGCHPAPERHDYQIVVEQCRTVAQLLGWNAHLHEKNWLDATDWDEFILRAGWRQPSARRRAPAGRRR